MSSVLRLVIVDPNDTSRESLKSMLLGMDIVWLEAECSRYEFFADVVGQTHPDIGVIGVDHDPAKALRLIQQLHESSPECTLLVVSSSTDGQFILQAMHHRSKGIPHSSRQSRRFGRGPGSPCRAALGQRGWQTRSSKVIAICGATGGVGSTSLAVNMGCILAKQAVNSVALVDLDLSLGDADVFLDTIPDYTLVDVAQNIARLDFTLLKRSLTKHSSGLYLLPRRCSYRTRR